MENVPTRIGNTNIHKHTGCVSLARLRPKEVVDYLDNRADLVRESPRSKIWWSITSENGKRIQTARTPVIEVGDDGLVPGTKRASQPRMVVEVEAEEFKNSFDPLDQEF